MTYIYRGGRMKVWVILTAKISMSLGGGYMYYSINRTGE